VAGRAAVSDVEQAAPEARARADPAPAKGIWRWWTRSGDESAGVFGALGVSNPRRVVIFIACLAAAFAVVLVPEATSELDPPARRGLFILTLSALLWVTDAIPAFAVGILVIGLQVALLGTERGGADTPRDWETYVAVLGDPMVWLFFGGFVLAAGMSRAGLDRRLAGRVLSRTGERPAAVLAGVMALAFVLSMCMSNTATTAMVLALLAPLLAALPPDDARGRALILGAAGGANLGGMGSLIGTPPNAVAAGALARVEDVQRIDFLRWLGLGLPIALLLAFGLWWLLQRRLPRDPLPTSVLRVPDEAAARPPRWERFVVGATVVLTVAAWATGTWHGIPTAAVSFIPIVMFTTTGVLGTREIRALPYDVLFLLAGGLALANVVSSSGLSDWIVDSLPVEDLGQWGIAFAFALLAVLLSTLMSNTAAANLLVPIGIAVAEDQTARVVLPIALCTSAAMALPIATPPNALAYATGRLRARDFLFPGLLIGAITPPLAVLWTRLWYE
jgi:sodium-dependent dicarboxylate transporter 2/3/5